MRRWKFVAAALTAVAAGAVALAVPEAGAVPVCNPTITIGNAQASEGDQSGRIWFPVTISAFAPCHVTGSASYETAPFTGPNAVPAEPGADYETPGGTFFWDKPAGTGTKTTSAPVVLKQDSLVESNEVFRVRLFNVQGATITSQWALGTIVDDDPQGELNPDDFDSPDCMVCNPGLACQFTVGLSVAISQPVTVGYATVDGSARAGEDFVGVRDGRMTIPAGATRGTFTIQVFRNPPGEPSEIFHVVLTSVSPGSIGRGRVEVHIPGGS